MIVQQTTGKDRSVVHYQTRPVAGGVEVRNGGIWVKLNAGEYVELTEDSEGRLYYKCDDCYGTGNGSAYLAPFGGYTVIHTVSGCNSSCDTCDGRGVVYVGQAAPVTQDMSGSIWQPQVTESSESHRCGICKRGEPTDGSFLGFHAHNRVQTGEVCDDCAHRVGCNCCAEISEFAWRSYLVEIGILNRMDDPREII